MEWINVNNKLPKTVEEENGTGQRYFSKDVIVQRGKRNWVACYKPSTKQWFTKNATEITAYVKYWKPIAII
jgi:hypothetical protein